MARATRRPSATRHRLEVRLSPEQDALIREAAALEATTLSSFVLGAVEDRARDVVAEGRDLVLSTDAYERFLAELDRPAERSSALEELFLEHPAPE